MAKNSILDSAQLKKHMNDKGGIILPKGIGDVRPMTKASKYDSLGNAKQSFNGIKFIQALNGQVVIRGRQGQRDMLYPLHRAVKMFFRMGLFYQKLKKNAPAIVYQFKAVLKDFGAKILQAVKQRAAMNQPLPPGVSGDKLEKIKLYLATDLGSKNIS